MIGKFDKLTHPVMRKTSLDSDHLGELRSELAKLRRGEGDVSSVCEKFESALQDIQSRLDVVESRTPLMLKVTAFPTARPPRSDVDLMDAMRTMSSIELAKIMQN